MIKKILIAIVCLFCANTVSAASMFDFMRITDTAALQSILEKWFPNNIEIRAKIAGYALENVKAGKSTNPAVLCELASMKDKTQCRNFIADIVWGATGFYVSACKSGATAPQGGEIVCNTLFHMLNVQQSQAVSLIKELDRLSIGNGLVCESGWNTRNNDDFIRCKSTKNKRVFYEFKLDDVRESFVDTVMESVRQGIFRIYGIDDYTDYYPEMSIEKCNSMKSSAAVFGLEPRLYSERSEFLGIKKPKSGNTFCALERKRSGPLSSVCNISNFVFCKDLQPNMDIGFMDYLSSYTAEKCQISPEQIKCEVGIRKYYGDKCNSSMFNPSDDIVSCNVPGKGYIDYVFDDVTEFSKITSNGDKQGMSCIVSGGTYSGKRCIGLGEQQCEVLRKSNLKNCPECKAAKWDDETQSCILPSSESAQNLQKGINIALIAGGAVIGVVVTVATAGTGTAIVLTAIETVGSAIELTSQLKINAIADDFLIKSNQCKNATCAKEMLSQNLQRMANYANEMTAAEADAIDAELERLANLIPADDEIWATILVNGTNMADNRLSFFDIDSWEPEQIWRAVGIGLQLASVVTSIGEWALKKSGRLAKSTATINAKFTATVDSVDRAQDGALTGNRLALKRKIAQMRSTNPTAGMSDTDVAFYELWKKYAPKNQSFDDFKAMTNGNLTEMQQYAKGWISWDEISNPEEAINLIQNERINFLTTHPKAMDLFQETGNFDSVAKQYPEFAELLERENRIIDIYKNGFSGNYSNINPNIKNIKATAQQNITLQKSMTETEVNMLRQQGYSEQEIDRLYTKIVEDTRKYTTDDVLRETAEQITISQLDDVALMRADQMHDIIESDSWLKSQKQNWYNLTTDEKREFAQEVSNKLLRKNGVAYDKTPEIQAVNLEIGNTGSYNKRKNVTQIDFDQVQNYETFIDVLAHENGGHAIDYLNPNAGAVGAQLQDATHDLYGVTYDAYRAKPTEQTSWRIGEISSVVNSYQEYNDLGEALMSAIQQKGIIPYNELTKNKTTYSTIDNLINDLFDSNKQITLLLDMTDKDIMDLADPLIKTGKFKPIEYNTRYIELMPIR